MSARFFFFQNKNEIKNQLFFNQIFWFERFLSQKLKFLVFEVNLLLHLLLYRYIFSILFA